MENREILRGRVTSYPAEAGKGLVEVSVGAYAEGGDTVCARVEQSMSGVYWLPEIGDVVEVELPDRPGGEPRIVHIHRTGEDAQTGACWTEQNDVKQIMTRSGHRVTLDDTEGQTAVTVHTAGGLELKLEDGPQTATLRADGKETPVLQLDMEHNAVRLEAGKELTIACGGASISIDSGGNISIQARGNLELGGQDVAVGAKNKLSASGQSAELTASLAATVEGKSQLDLTSGGITQVKGGMVKLN